MKKNFPNHEALFGCRYIGSFERKLAGIFYDVYLYQDKKHVYFTKGSTPGGQYFRSSSLGVYHLAFDLKKLTLPLVEAALDPDLSISPEAYDIKVS